MANLKYGSKGDEVKQLQQALISAGYDVGGSGADGSYGPATQAAVTQYQKDHGLSVDGLAGPETQGALYSSGGTTTGSSGGTRNYAGTTYQSGDYHKDATTAAAAGDWEKVKEALNNREIVTGSLGTNYGKTSMDIYNELLEQYGGPQNEMNKLYASLGNLMAQFSQPVPAPTPSWGDQKYEELLKQAIAMNYDDWTQGDQYKSLVSRYGNQGKMSMQDVLGQISSRTGGLASSYATTAAQQQYNEYMSQLEEVARQMFAGERSDLIENAGLARDYGEQEYGRYLDQLNMQNDRNSYALDVINQMMGYQQNKANTQYTQGQDAKTEAQDRINSYLAAYGSVADLDPNLVRDSGYTQSELATIERYYADQKEKEAATGGGGGNEGGTQKPTLTAAQVLSALDNGIVNDTTKAAYEYYYGQPYEVEEEPEKEPAKPAQSGTSNAYGPSYTTAWGQARKMYDNGKSDEEIMAYLDTFSEDRLTDAGLRYIMNSLHLGGYKE